MKEISDVREFSGDESFLPIKALIKDNEIPEKEAVLRYIKSFEADCGAGMSLIDEIKRRK